MHGEHCLKNKKHPEAAFYQGLELNFVYGTLTCGSAIILAVLSLLLRACDYNLAPLALMAAVSKIK